MNTTPLRKAIECFIVTKYVFEVGYDKNSITINPILKYRINPILKYRKKKKRKEKNQSILKF